MPSPVDFGHLSRRRLLTRAATIGGVALGARTDWLAALVEAQACDDAPAGDLVRTLPLYGPGAVDTPLGQMVGGAGLDARLFTDLSRLEPGRMVTPGDAFFVRTIAPQGTMKPY